MGESPLRAALRWLAHPVSLVSIAVMAFNDHVLKQAYGTWWTGKLSDVAGLIFFPALIAVVFAFIVSRSARPPSADAFHRLVLVATVVTGVGFAWVKVTAVGAATASAVLTTLAGPLFDGNGVVRADATDLLALPALGLAVWVARRTPAGTTAARARLRAGLGVAMLPVAVLASVATTPGVDFHDETTIVADASAPDGWVLVVRDCFTPHSDAELSCFRSATYEATDQGFRKLDVAPDPSADDSAPALAMSCSQAQPELCFRTSGDRAAVEESADGGTTWALAWQLPPESVERVSAFYGVEPDQLVSAGVGVHDTAGGVRVFVANRADGVLARGADGSWQRVGFSGLDGYEKTRLASLTAPVGRQAQDDRIAVDPALWGVAIWIASGPWLAGALAWRKRNDDVPTAVALATTVTLLVAYGMVEFGMFLPGLGLSMPAAGALGDAAILGVVAWMVAIAIAILSLALSARGALGLWWRVPVGAPIVGAVAGVSARLFAGSRTADPLGAMVGALVVAAIYVVLLRNLAPLVRRAETGTQRSA